MLDVRNLRVSVDGVEVVKGVSLSVSKGELVALMGPNGSGKSSLALALMGHPKYKVISGSVCLAGKDITSSAADVRARQGLYLSFQNPVEVQGVGVENFLRQAFSKMGVMDFHFFLQKKMSDLGISPEFSGRNLNEGFSGGERKKMEVLQMELMNPKMAILDEVDSGLDADALKSAVKSIKRHKDAGVLIITHNKRMLENIKPNRVYVMLKGKIVAIGDFGLVSRIEKEGYAQFGGSHA